MLGRPLNRHKEAPGREQWENPSSELALAILATESRLMLDSGKTTWI